MVSVIQCLDQDESSVYARPFDRMPVGYTLGYSLGRVASVLYIRRYVVLASQNHISTLRRASLLDAHSSGVGHPSAFSKLAEK